jgi:lipopolysaccharide/colanic/teichoic acid biosynthesis glycosyltransferase
VKNTDLAPATQTATLKNSGVVGRMLAALFLSEAPKHVVEIPDVRRSKAEQRSIPVSVRAVKRAIDLCVAGVGLVLFVSFLPLFALAIRLDSAGPIFYRQRRVRALARRDAHGRCTFVEFDMLKFRTMYTNAEKRTGAVLAEENDPRVTRVGRFLRRTRLDELPQLLNVLRGEMSLVGPRPERAELFENLAFAIPYFEERIHDAKPGITGFAQVSLGYAGRPPPGSPTAQHEDALTNPFGLESAKGALADDMRMKLLFDLAYVTALERFHTFIWLELLVIVKTPLVMLRGLGR